ncbi:alpha/beta hydrolase [Pedobacter sp. KBW06]|uniref:alpha/beta fold hydrolase n=1 Tax=Pedobacter sp. KBW06 TaxID=2153359 RepID=UPI000F5A4892|nr:alpha/beta hydrolase [Pedobacter sp. KBW06]RQO66116.1 alpha/beta hydrolase [Pedobacter sp. KBW06]
MKKDLRNNLLYTFCKLVTITCILGIVTIGDCLAQTPLKKGYATLKELRLYYEIHGQGKPLVLIHGGLGCIELFDPILKNLAATRQVIAVDLQAHGRTADINRPLSYEAMADDIAGLLEYLHISTADLMGFSLGGGVVQQVAIRHPQMVIKLVVLSAPYKHAGWYPEIQQGQAQMAQAAEALKSTPLYGLYTSLAPRKEDWPVLCTKLADFLKKDYDWSKEVAAIRKPVLLIAGDADAVPPSHLTEFFGLLGGGKKDGGWDGAGVPVSSLAILPRATHYNVISSATLVPVVTAFLDKQAGQRR